MTPYREIEKYADTLHQRALEILLLTIRIETKGLPDSVWSKYHRKIRYLRESIEYEKHIWEDRADELPRTILLSVQRSQAILKIAEMIEEQKAEYLESEESDDVLRYIKTLANIACA